MNRRTMLSLSAVLALALPLSANARTYADHPSCKDPALFTRMPGFFLLNPSACEKRQFDQREFVLKEGSDRQKVAVEGAYSYYRYGFDKASGTPPSTLQVLRNYQNAAKAAGGEMLYENVRNGFTTLRIAKDGKEVWVHVAAGNAQDFTLHIIEKAAMKQDITANAAVLDAGLASTGHVEVPGIFFDTGKSVIKPESEAALVEVAKLLKQNASLKVWVVGHTDFVGTPDSNMSLSSARAAAVAKALAEKHGIAAARLGAYGAGPYAPIASNAAEDGRARNRRVELVARQ